MSPTFMGVQASTNAFACFKDLLGDATPRTKGVDHEIGVKGGDSSAKDPDSGFLTTFWSFRGRPSVGNGLNTDIRWCLVGVLEPRVDSSRYIYTSELCGAQSSPEKRSKNPPTRGFSNYLCICFPFLLRDSSSFSSHKTHGRSLCYRNEREQCRFLECS